MYDKIRSILAFVDIPSFWDKEYVVFYRNNSWAYIIRLLVIMAVVPYILFFLTISTLLFILSRFIPDIDVKAEINDSYLRTLEFLWDMIKTVIFPIWLRNEVEKEYMLINMPESED